MLSPQHHQISSMQPVVGMHRGAPAPSFTVFAYGEERGWKLNWNHPAFEGRSDGRGRPWYDAAEEQR